MPHTQGIAYELTPSDYEVAVSRTRVMLPTVPTAVVPVRAVKFAEGDSSKPLGDIERAFLLVGKAEHAPQLHPTREWVGQVSLALLCSTRRKGELTPALTATSCSSFAALS